MHVVIDADIYADQAELDAAIQETQADATTDRITIVEAQAGRWVRWHLDGTGAWDVDGSSDGLAVSLEL